MDSDQPTDAPSRRSFLKTTLVGAGAAGAAAGGLLAADSASALF